MYPHVFPTCCKNAALASAHVELSCGVIVSFSCAVLAAFVCVWPRALARCDKPFVSIRGVSICGNYVHKSHCLKQVPGDLPVNWNACLAATLPLYVWVVRELHSIVGKLHMDGTVRTFVECYWLIEVDTKILVSLV